MEFAQLVAEGGGFEIGVAGDEQEAVPGFHQIGAGGCCCRGRNKPEKGMIVDLVRAVVKAEGDGGCGFGDHADAAVDNSVLHEAFAGEGSIIARRPGGARDGVVREPRRDGERGCGFARGDLSAHGGGMSGARDAGSHGGDDAAREQGELGHIWGTRLAKRYVRRTRDCHPRACAQDPSCGDFGGSMLVCVVGSGAKFCGRVCAERWVLGTRPRMTAVGVAAPHPARTFWRIRAGAATFSPLRRAAGRRVSRQSRLTVGILWRVSMRSVSAQTRASRRSGLLPSERPSAAKSHIWRSSSGNVPK